MKKIVVITVLFILIVSSLFYLLSSGKSIEIKSDTKIEIKSKKKLFSDEQFGCNFTKNKEVVTLDSYNVNGEGFSGTLLICKINIENEEILVYQFKSNSDNDIKNILNNLKLENLIYTGLPTGFYLKEKLEEYYIGEVSTDDCGYDGENIMDINCAQGFGVVKFTKYGYILLSEVFTGDREEKNFILKSKYSELI